MQEIINKLTAKEDNSAYAFADMIISESRETDVWYESLDAFARKTGATSTFGARLDTVADFLFAAVSFGKLLPVIRMPVWLWGWVAAIAVIKLVNLICGFLRRKQIPTLHTMMNKVSGFYLFMLPLTMARMELRYTAPVVCAVATIAAIQEGSYIAADRDIV